MILQEENNLKTDMIQTKEIKIKCSDNFELAGTLYETTDLKAAIMLAPATGIKRKFYHSFCKFLAQNGYAILSFDNRGIGDSLGNYQWSECFISKLGKIRYDWSFGIFKKYLS